MLLERLLDMIVCSLYGFIGNGSLRSDCSDDQLAPLVIQYDYDCLLMTQNSHYCARSHSRRLIKSTAHNVAAVGNTRTVDISYSSDLVSDSDS